MHGMNIIPHLQHMNDLDMPHHANKEASKLTRHLYRFFFVKKKRGKDNNLTFYFGARFSNCPPVIVFIRLFFPFPHYSSATHSSQPHQTLLCGEYVSRAHCWM